MDYCRTARAELALLPLSDDLHGILADLLGEYNV